MLKLATPIRSAFNYRTTSVNALACSKRYFVSSRVHREHYLDATPEIFEKVVLKKSKKPKSIVVDFYADWCQPCRMLSPTLEKLTKDNGADGKQFDLVTINVDHQPELAAQYKVTALPTVIGFKNGEKVDSFIGVIPESAVRKFLVGI